MALFLLGWVDGTQKQKQPGVDDHRSINTLERQDLALIGNIWLRIGTHGHAQWRSYRRWLCRADGIKANLISGIKLVVL